MSRYPLSEQGDVERRGLRDQVYERILQMLLDGNVEAGMRLSIDGLARQLGVSPTPVREAMVELERTGLVTREALRGYRVAPPLDAATLDELFEARLMLETHAARLASRRRAKLRADLAAAHARHCEVAERVAAALGADEAVPSQLTHDYFVADRDFHRVIFRWAGNRYLADMDAHLGAQVHRMRQAVLRGPHDVREAIAEHAAIVAAFAGDDPDAPAAAMYTHICNVRDRSLQDAARAWPTR